ncbi:hypothetical protein [Micromonospora sp. NBRC 107095]|uniref:hypothetical protein n=1 Tax=Micromonospora sp. NBRC 107095 TaxID=3032209 RepID=UPI0024A54AC5|nr:hypothetical protein [Micromonospora sp. NBRC 107095]GLZ57309.1 hypothetical protein Misp05_08850 [Micromonospora sp. NBRC 107095]
MTIDSLPAGRASAALEVTGARPQLDYYLVGVSDSTSTVEGIVVEEFTRDRDLVTTGLDSAAWTPQAGWWSSGALSRDIRTNPQMLARVVPTSRRQAEDVHRALGGGQLPDEALLRTHFLDHQPIASAPPLRLGPAQPPAGFHERRVYRVLFAKDLRPEQVAALRTAWRTPAAGTSASPGTSASVASGHLDGHGDQFSWDLRRVGHTLAWGLDVTALLATGATAALGSTVSALTNVLRQHGLIPVTTERFS